jgi:hypothetical protein
MVQLNLMNAITSSGQVWVGGFAGGNTNQPQAYPEMVTLANDRQIEWDTIPYFYTRLNDPLGLVVPMSRVPYFVPTIE